LKKLLEDYDSKSAFGKAVGIDQSYISHVLGGRRSLGPVLCCRIEKALGLDEGWFEIT
jgi:plasmid maintenance system antidote protein VapI